MHPYKHVNKYTPHRCVVSVTNTLPSLTSAWAGSISSNTALRKQEISWRMGGAVTFIKFPHLYLFHIFLTNYVSTELSLSHIFLGHRLFQRSLHCHSNSNSWHHPHQKHSGSLQLKSSFFCNSFLQLDAFCSGILCIWRLCLTEVKKCIWWIVLSRSWRNLYKAHCREF